MANYPKKQEVFEILEKVSSTKSRKEKIKILQEHESNMALLDVLRGTFDDTIQWNLPGGTPPYSPNEPQSYPSSLRKQHLNFKYFVKGLQASNQLNSIRRERMFIDMLEAVHPEDAKILVSMINKKSPVKGLTKKLVEEAFDDLIRS